MKRTLTIFVFLCLLICLFACERHKPIKIGFVGGLSGRVADLGRAGRDGASLAIEECNGQGGINGILVELLVRDDAQDASTVASIIHELAKDEVLAVVGPMTSAMAVAASDAANLEQLVLLSPTTSTSLLSGRDDYFLRIYPENSQASTLLAEEIFDVRHVRNLAVAYDLANRQHTQDWLDGLRLSYLTKGGQMAAEEGFYSGAMVSFSQLAEDLVKSNPDGVLLVASALDTAMIAQQLSKMNVQLPLFGTEWSGTEDVILNGAGSVEGLTFFHTFDFDDTSARFLAFQDTFFKRFGYEAGFAAVHSYDATRLLLAALKKNPSKAEIRKTLLSLGPFQGLQGQINLDRFGDVTRQHFLMTVQNGRFVHQLRH